MGSRQFDPLALSRGRYLPVESAMPGTTLEVIPMEASRFLIVKQERPLPPAAACTTPQASVCTWSLLLQSAIKISS